MEISMPSVTTLEDLFVELLKDIYYAEKKILKALPKMAKKVGKESDLAKAFEKHREETEGQVHRLEQVFAIVGQKPKAKKCAAIEGLAEEADELMQEVKDKPTLEAGLLAGAQAVEHYEMARYGTLVEWAKLLGHEDAARLLNETLEQEKKTDELLTKMAQSSINEAACCSMKKDDEDEESSSKSSSPKRRAA
jgi:ferritin-like metal-binding protein YciE